MYQTLLSLHSLVRWLVLLSLLISLVIAYRGWLSKKTFSKRDNSIRHWTTTIAHAQLLIGLWVYSISPLIRYFWSNFEHTVHQRPTRFFGMEHSLMMIVSVVLITIGSMKTKRKSEDQEKFKTMTIWFSIALVIILVNLPWPFSPFASRGWVRF